MYLSANNEPIDEHITNPNPRIRSLVISLTKNSQLIKKSINDPDLYVRRNALQRVHTSIKLLTFLNDSTEIKKIVVDKLSNPEFLKNQSMNNITLIFNGIASMINDINVDIRIKVAYNLRNFTMINDNILIELLSKKNAYEQATLGSFIHGLEDECYLIRVYTIESMCILVQNEKIANCVFDFLTHLLNDSMEHVKETAAINMLKITNKFLINADIEMIDLIFCNFEEKNDNIRNWLYNTIACLSYDEKMIIYVYEKMKIFLDRNINKKKIFYVLKMLVQRYKNHFFKISDYKKSNYMEKQPALNDHLHFCEVIILGELLKSKFKIKYNKYMRKHLLYYRLKEEFENSIENGNEKIKRIKLIEFSQYKEITMRLIEELSHNKDYKYLFDKYESIFVDTNMKTHNDTFYVLLYKALKIYYIYNGTNEYTKLCILYNINCNISCIKQLIMEQNEFIKNSFVIEFQRPLRRKFNLPIKLEVTLFYILSKYDNFYLRVRNIQAVYYHKIQEKYVLYIYEEIDEIFIDIIYKMENGEIIELLEATRITIEK